MKTQYQNRWLPTAVTACMLFSVVAQAEPTDIRETQTTREELAKLVDAALPEVITQDNIGLVSAFADALQRQLEATTPLSKGFDPAAASVKIFGDATPKRSPDCTKLTTSNGDLARDECSMYVGIERGTGPFKQFKFSKNTGLGNIRFLQRNADKAFSLTNIRPIDLADADAYAKAMDFLGGVFGLDSSEIPTAPKDAKNPYPVKTINMGWNKDARTKPRSVSLEKLVQIRRGFQFDYPMATRSFPIRGPIGDGKATVVIDNTGIQQALVSDWQDAKLHPGLNPKAAKTRAQLISEIMDDLYTSSQGPYQLVKARFIGKLVQQTNSSTALLLPAVQISVSPVARDLTEEQQAQVISTAGFTEEYLLAETGEQMAGIAP